MLFLSWEASVMFSPYWSLLPKKYYKKYYLDVHGYMQFAAFTLFLFGYTAIYIDKENRGKLHFTTNHGIYGLILAPLFFLPTCNGIVIKYIHLIPLEVLIRLKAIHAFEGTLAIFFSILSMVTGFFSKWFIRETHFVVPYLLSVIFIIGNIFVTLRVLKSNKLIPKIFQREIHQD